MFGIMLTRLKRAAGLQAIGWLLVTLGPLSIAPTKISATLSRRVQQVACFQQIDDIPPPVKTGCLDDTAIWNSRICLKHWGLSG
ncbi:hypothetical protein PC120_g21834 [Phytophthora cactorum]|nr:hypothetical protein PC120_g21834 [Phytophthora cactorum]